MNWYCGLITNLKYSWKILIHYDPQPSWIYFINSAGSWVVVDQYFTKIFEICDQSTIPIHVLKCREILKNAGTLILITYMPYSNSSRLISMGGQNTTLCLVPESKNWSKKLPSFEKGCRLTWYGLLFTNPINAKQFKVAKFSFILSTCKSRMASMDFLTNILYSKIIPVLRQASERKEGENSQRIRLRKCMTARIDLTMGLEKLVTVFRWSRSILKVVFCLRPDFCG